MLVSFNVENCLSFKNEVGLNLIATSDKEHEKQVFVDDTGKPISLLRTAAIYGANAAGKSNIVKAIEFARKLILSGTKGEQSIDAKPFKLDADTMLSPSKFEFVIKYKGNLYTYGFIINNSEVLEEWLFVVKKRNEMKYFERINNKKGDVIVDIGPSLAKANTKRQQFLEFVAQGTRPNQLFLSEAFERNVKEIKPLIEWFKDVLVIITPEYSYTGLILKAHKDESFTKFIGDFLKVVGTGIEGIESTSSLLNFEEDLFDMPKDVLEHLKEDCNKLGDNGGILLYGPEGQQYVIEKNKDGKFLFVVLKTQHKHASGEMVSFEIEEESDGTKRLLNLLPSLIESGDNEKVFIIDELDRSMHPLLSKTFLKFYLENRKSTQGQLIFSTHETNLLDLNLLRRDEIWFIEKDENGSSHLYSLAEFKPRKDLKIQKGYMQGRFGAIPFFGDVESLGFSQN